MKAYKATYNYKCRDQEYKVGKVYTSDKMKLCKHGIHFCPVMDDVLDYYEPSKDLVVLEIEILGKTEYDFLKGVERKGIGHKGVTDKIKVLREVPYEEYSDEMKKQFPVHEYGPRGEIVTTTYSNGIIRRFEYDSEGNMISKVETRDPCRYEYGCVFRAEGRKSFEIHPMGMTCKYEYFPEKNKMAMSYSNGSYSRIEYATITESDS